MKKKNPKLTLIHGENKSSEEDHVKVTLAEVKAYKYIFDKDMDISDNVPPDIDPLTIIRGLLDICDDMNYDETISIVYRKKQKDGSFSCAAQSLPIPRIGDVTLNLPTVSLKLKERN